MPPLPTSPSKSPLKEVNGIQNGLNGAQNGFSGARNGLNGTPNRLNGAQNGLNGTQNRLNGAQSRLNGALPPIAPSAKRYTAIKKSHTTNLDEKIEQLSQKTIFQPRPLKNIQILGRSTQNGTQNNLKNGYSKSQNETDLGKISDGVQNEMQELKNRLQNIRSSSVGARTVEEPKKPENGFINQLRRYRGSNTAPKLSISEDTISDNGQNFQEFKKRLQGIRSSSLGPRNDLFTPRTIPEDTVSEGAFSDYHRRGLRSRNGERTSRMIERDMNTQIRRLQGLRSASVGAAMARINQNLRTPSAPSSNTPPQPPRSGNIRSSSVGSLNGYPNLRSRSLGPSFGSTNSLSTISRSISPCSSIISESSTAPRRIFPQVGASVGDLSELEQKEQSPVVFDANLTFVIGCKSQVRENIKPTAAHLDKDTASNLLTTKISDFLKRTDHVMDEWRGLGHKDDDRTWGGNIPQNAEERRVLHRSRSATNIMIKGFQYYSRASSVARSNSMTREMRDFSEDRFTDMTDFDELSEMTADLAEEHSTSTLATERLDAETQERVRLERELSELQNKNRSLQQSSERLEMELLYARSDLNGLNSEEEDENDEGVYKQRYERVARELEFTRRRLQQQHEDDLEQLVGLKKQLEKKLSDAYEEVEEQRQVVGQWKRKVQKLNAETNDLRLLLEEQNARNNLLEKKQRKFDSESGLLHDELRQEKQTKERIAREKEIVLAEKYTLENNLADTKLECDMKEEKINSLQRELDELTFGGKTEEEVTLLRKQKMELERRLHEQEEELDELAGQTQLLEQAKLRLEMSLEQLRKEAKREAQQRDEELEEVRCNAQKKVKALESQLENEHEERTLLLREKHELDRRLTTLTESQRGDRAQEEAQLVRLRRDLKRTKALLRDAQTMIERYRADSTSRAVLRQLRNQLEDAECARSNAVKAKQVVEGELSEVQAQLEEAQRLRSEADDRFNSANRERTELRTQLEENEEELAEVLKKYRSAVQQASVDQLTLQEQVSLVSELESERNSLRERLAELTTKLESLESLGDPSSNLMAKRMELKCKELESKLELEQTTRSRLEVQIARLKETVDKLQSELVSSRTKEQGAQDAIRKLQRSLRELRDEHVATAARESECLQKRKELEKKVEACEAETSAAKADLKLAMKRIDDLQSAIQGELEDTLSDHSESEQDSYSSDESIETFLANHKLAPTKSKSSLKLDSTSPV